MRGRLMKLRRQARKTCRCWCGWMNARSPVVVACSLLTGMYAPAISHYVGQEKLRPQTGWAALAFALDWGRPPRQMNSTSFFYAHTDQWRDEKLGVDEILSPLADPKAFGGSMIDYNVRAERMGWLPSAPQLQTSPLHLARDAAASGLAPKDDVVKGLQDGSLLRFRDRSLSNSRRP
ncbi:hypothetical protein THIX_90444 [Thiomonas sp. X19]|nr:hypothetical protein THIX_90444 [Thiomonas sp. X19]